LPAEAQDFKKKFEEAQEINAKIIGIPVTAEPDEEAEAADELADQVAKAAV
jgi:peroxiredoxin